MEAQLEHTSDSPWEVLTTRIQSSCTTFSRILIHNIFVLLLSLARLVSDTYFFSEEKKRKFQQRKLVKKRERKIERENKRKRDMLRGYRDSVSEMGGDKRELWRDRERQRESNRGREKFLCPTRYYDLRFRFVFSLIIIVACIVPNIEGFIQRLASSDRKTSEEQTVKYSLQLSNIHKKT